MKVGGAADESLGPKLGQALVGKNDIDIDQTRPSNRTRMRRTERSRFQALRQAPEGEVIVVLERWIISSMNARAADEHDPCLFERNPQWRETPGRR